MYLYDVEKGLFTETSGGSSSCGLPVRDTFVKLDRNQRGILYEPAVRTQKSKTAVVIVHSDDDYSTRPMGGELAKRGYTAFCGAVSDRMDPLDKKMLDIRHIVEFLKSYPGVEHVFLMGHSGGATLMSAYQAVAENGVSVFRGEHMLVSCSLEEDLPPADGLMLIDSNWGNGSMTLFSIDPAVTEEGNGVKLDPRFDLFDPANGYDPDGAHYTENFKKDFFAAQRERNNRLVRLARERLHAIENGKGRFVDDEPFIIAGGTQTVPGNKLFPQDTGLFAHTKGIYDLLHGDGTVTRERIRSVRRPGGRMNPTPLCKAGTLVTTVKSFLTGKAVLADESYCIKADGAEGILWDNSYDCTPGNVKKIHAPLLCMGMTGSYEYLAAEAIFLNAACTDKTIAFVEGAGHNFAPEHRCEAWPGQFGDTEKTLYDFMDQWMSRQCGHERYL